MIDIGWEALRSLAAVVSAMCAVVAACISGAIWRKARSSDLGQRIADGDKSVREFAEKKLNELADSVGEVQDSVARLESMQEVEIRNMVSHKDLSDLHEKINRVAIDAAATRATNTSINEQLRVIQNFMLQERQK